MSRLPAATGCGHRLKRNDHAGHSGNLKIDRGWLCGCGGFYALPAARLELTGRNRGVGDFWAGSSIVSDDFAGCWDIKRGGFAFEHGSAFLLGEGVRGITAFGRSI